MTPAFCSRCGAPIEVGLEFCKGCGFRLAGAPPPPFPPGMGGPYGMPYAPGYGAPPWTVGGVRYAGFWIRVAALLLDGLIVGGGAFAVAAVFAVVVMAATEDSDATAITAGISYYALAIFGDWLYSALLESSRHQATLGKKIVGICVTDLQGNRISFGRASGRHFGKILSGMILYIGFMMAGWTEKKQGLHDMMAGTLVVYR